jgi:hypothetical protein
MNYDFNENDEILDPADTIHEERDVDVKLGKRIAREKKYNALVGEVTAGPMDDDCLTSLIERDMGKEVAENIVEVAQRSPVAVEAKDAINQRQHKYADAMKEWDGKLKQDEGMRVASGFKPTGKAPKPIVENSGRAKPSHIRDAIERGNIKGDKSRLNETLHQFFSDFNGVADAFGIRAANEESSVDHAMQRDSNGKMVFGDMTYDRKRRAQLREDGQAEIASENRVRVRTADGKGYDGATRIITSVGAVDNASYNPARGDLLLAERVTDTKQRTEEVAVFVGPLLPELLKAIFENATATEIGESLGFSAPQASAVGNAMLQRALEAAADAYDRIKKRQRRKWTYSEWLREQPDGMPIPARKAKRAFIELAVAKPANDNMARVPAAA